MLYNENNIVKIPISSDQHQTDRTTSMNIIPLYVLNECISLEESKRRIIEKIKSKFAKHRQTSFNENIIQKK